MLAHKSFTRIFVAIFLNLSIDMIGVIVIDAVVDIRIRHVSVQIFL